MKKFALIFMASALLLAGCNRAPASIYLNNYKTAKITYQLTGNPEGTSLLYIKGDKTSRQITAVNHGQNGKDTNENTLYIDADGMLYRIDLNAKTGTSSPNPVYDEIQSQPEAQRASFLKKLVVGFGKVENGDQKPVRQENIAGQACDVYQAKDFGEICLWNNIPLRTTIDIPSIGLKSDTVATKVETNVDIDESLFAVPAGIQMNEVASAQINSQQLTQSDSEAIR